MKARRGRGPGKQEVAAGSADAQLRRRDQAELGNEDVIQPSAGNIGGAEIGDARKITGDTRVARWIQRHAEAPVAIDGIIATGNARPEKTSGGVIFGQEHVHSAADEVGIAKGGRAGDFSGNISVTRGVRGNNIALIFVGSASLAD